MIYDLYKNRTEKDVSQTIKDSIHKYTDAAVFLEKTNRDILNLRREKIALKLNQLIFKTEDHPKLLFGHDLPKTIKVGQSLTQIYQPTLKREIFI